MGISDFYELIKERCPEVLVTMNLSELAGVSVAVDISIFLNKYVKSAGEIKWIDSFIILLTTLKKHSIKPVCIFDGPNPPIEKKREQERRRAEAAKKRDRIGQGKDILARLKKMKKLTSEDHVLIDEIKIILGPKREKNQNINYRDIEDVKACLVDALEKMERQNLPILPEYSRTAKEIIEIMGFAHFQADGEAEALCSGLCHHGYVDAVLSEDTDVLAIGAPFLLSKLDLSKQTVTAISYQDILDSLEMESEEFRDLCIMLGCDYNERVKGYPPDGKKRKKPVSLGVKGAYWMIAEYRRIEYAEEFIVDTDPLNYRRCRELLTPPSDLSHISIPYNRPIETSRLTKFLTERKVSINIGYILSSWKPTPIKKTYLEDTIVEEDDVEW